MGSVSGEVRARLAKHGRAVLCGRMVNGRYVCQGELALVFGPDLEDGLRQITMFPGMTEDPPGSGWWRPTARAARVTASGRTGWKVRAHNREGFNSPPMPWRIHCPHCRTVAVITSDLLSG